MPKPTKAERDHCTGLTTLTDAELDQVSGGDVGLGLGTATDETVNAWHGNDANNLHSRPASGQQTGNGTFTAHIAQGGT